MMMINVHGLYEFKKIITFFATIYSTYVIRG